MLSKKKKRKDEKEEIEEIVFNYFFSKVDVNM